LPTRFCPAGQLGSHRTLSTFGFLPSHKSNPKKPKELNFPTAPKNQKNILLLTNTSKQL